jgi:hypothetical protein
MPPAGVTHVAWQVGHLAFAEHRLALWRIRGERPDDADLIPQQFRNSFGAQSVPDPDPAKYLDQAEIRALFDRVHAQVLWELPELKEEDLDLPVPHPHPYAKTKLQALWWCAHHEMAHCHGNPCRRSMALPRVQSFAEFFLEKCQHAFP